MSRYGLSQDGQPLASAVVLTEARKLQSPEGGVDAHDLGTNISTKLTGAPLSDASEWSEKPDVDSSAMLREGAQQPRVSSFQVR